jgi:hypothetical protein
MKITEKTFDVVTGEETITEREETIAEKDARLKHEGEILAEKQTSEALTVARAEAQAKLAALGLTADDLKALGL